MRHWAMVMFLTGSLNVGYGQWTIQSSGTSANLRGIDSLGNGLAWASGSRGTVLRTMNDGKLWQGCTIPPDAEKLDFRAIQAFDEKTAIVMSSGPGAQSRLYKTMDGCQTWKLVFTNPDQDGFWDTLQFYRGTTVSGSTGILVGDPVKGSFAVFSTDDAGATWHRWGNDARSGQVQARVGESLFAASNSSAVSLGINGGYVFVTGGKGGSRLLFVQGHSPFDTSSKAIPIPSSTSAGAFSIGRRSKTAGKSGRFSGDAGTFVIVGGDYLIPDSGSAATVSRSAFLHKLAIRSAKTPPHGYRSAVAYDAPNKTWITVGPNGTDISTDDGRHWQSLMPTSLDELDTDKHWNALSLPFVVGPNGRIGKLRTTTPNLKGANPSLVR